jgi:predicted RNA-binding Zn-ribbon protein involved in translation (DUF1610 family)
MGMFDSVNFECVCPTCGNKVIDFQSKDRDCQLDMLEVWQVSNYYSACDVCGTWIEYHRDNKEETRRVIDTKHTKPEFK